MGVLKRAVGERMGGSRPSMWRALGAAAVVGAAAAGITYRVLRG
jgi:hypothetical protein